MAQADTNDTDQTRLAHIKCMLVHLEQQEREAAPIGAPADVATELSAMDGYLGVSRLDRRAHCRMRGRAGSRPFPADRADPLIALAMAFRVGRAH